MESPTDDDGHPPPRPTPVIDYRPAAAEPAPAGPGVVDVFTGVLSVGMTLVFGMVTVGAVELLFVAARGTDKPFAELVFFAALAIGAGFGTYVLAVIAAGHFRLRRPGPPPDGGPRRNGNDDRRAGS